ncbi:MAG: DUF1295 domain-containing protein [Bacteroidota bacterium]
MKDIYASLLIAIGFNLWIFLVAYFFSTDLLTDISYSATFLIVLSHVFTKHTTRVNTIAYLMILVWAFRLGGYLFLRIVKTRKDKRFDQIRNSFIKFLGFFTLQGVTVFMVIFPCIYLFQQEEENLTLASMPGFVTYLLGIMIESIADHQKYRFRNDPKNKDKWIAHGLWHHSRHPNYFGEILVWTGLYLFAFPHLAHTHRMIGAASPLYIFCLLYFVSGVPMLEKSADKRWGKDPAYQDYKKRTSILIPFIW